MGTIEIKRVETVGFYVGRPATREELEEALRAASGEGEDEWASLEEADDDEDDGKCVDDDEGWSKGRSAEWWRQKHAEVEEENNRYRHAIGYACNQLGALAPSDGEDYTERLKTTVVRVSDQLKAYKSGTVNMSGRLVPPPTSTVDYGPGVENLIRLMDDVKFNRDPQKEHLWAAVREALARASKVGEERDALKVRLDTEVKARRGAEVILDKCRVACSSSMDAEHSWKSTDRVVAYHVVNLEESVRELTESRDWWKGQYEKVNGAYDKLVESNDKLLEERKWLVSEGDGVEDSSYRILRATISPSGTVRLYDGDAMVKECMPQAGEVSNVLCTVHRIAKLAFKEGEKELLVRFGQVLLTVRPGSDGRLYGYDDAGVKEPLQVKARDVKVHSVVVGEKWEINGEVFRVKERLDDGSWFMVGDGLPAHDRVMTREEIVSNSWTKVTQLKEPPSTGIAVEVGDLWEFAVPEEQGSAMNGVYRVVEPVGDGAWNMFGVDNTYNLHMHPEAISKGVWIHRGRRSDG